MPRLLAEGGLPRERHRVLASSKASLDRASSVSPTAILPICHVTLGTPEEIRTPLDYKPVQSVIRGVGIEVQQIVDESLPIEVKETCCTGPRIRYAT